MTFIVSGMVESVDRDAGTIAGFFDGVPGDFVARATPEMPEWMLQPDAAFRAEVDADALRRRDWDGLQWRNLSQREFVGMSESELIDAITEALL